MDALQCKQSKTIATDLGFINVESGDWIVSGEGGETYVVDDEYFQRTFVLARVAPHTSIAEPTDAQCAPLTELTTAPFASSRTCVSRNPTHGVVRRDRRRKARISQ